MGVCADLTVTASWDCIAEILDLTPDIPHARGFNATERSGAVTVAAAMAAYTQLGILPSPSTVMMFRMPTTPSLTTSRPGFSASDEPPWQSGS